MHNFNLFRYMNILRTCLASALALTVVGLSAQDYSARYNNLPVELSQVTAPVIPDLSVNITDFGGVGDGLQLNTEAFAKAIKHLASQGGGHLIVPCGVWLTGPIAMKSNIDLHLEQGALVLFSPDKALYQKEGSTRGLSCIYGSKLSNISITGNGILDGNGKYWRPVKRSKVSDVEWKDYNEMGGTQTDGGQLWFPFGLKHFDNITAEPKKEEAIRADLIRFVDCKNMLFKDVTIQNSPRFHLHPIRCNNVIIDGVTVRCPWNAQNGDGIDLSNCQTCAIVNSTVDVGDDGICMKGGTGDKGLEDGPCKDILIEDNIVYHAHGGFVIGSDVSGGMVNIVVRNCTFSGTDTGLRFKSSVGRGGKTENIFISSISMNDIRDAAITFSCAYEDKKYSVNNSDEAKKVVAAPFSPDFTDIHISNVFCREAKTAIFADGIEGIDAVHNIVISNSTIFYTKTGANISNTADVKLDNVKLVTFDK